MLTSEPLPMLQLHDKPSRRKIVFQPGAFRWRLIRTQMEAYVLFKCVGALFDKNRPLVVFRSFELTTVHIIKGCQAGVLDAQHLMRKSYCGGVGSSTLSEACPSSFCWRPTRRLLWSKRVVRRRGASLASLDGYPTGSGTPNQQLVDMFFFQLFADMKKNSSWVSSNQFCERQLQEAQSGV